MHCVYNALCSEPLATGGGLNGRIHQDQVRPFSHVVNPRSTPSYQGPVGGNKWRMTKPVSQRMVLSLSKLETYMLAYTIASKQHQNIIMVAVLFSSTYCKQACNPTWLPRLVQECRAPPGACPQTYYIARVCAFTSTPYGGYASEYLQTCKVCLNTRWECLLVLSECSNYL